MSLRFEAKSPDEIEREADARREEARKKYAPWPKGEYTFEVVQATEKHSKSGNPMIELDLTVFNAAGESRDLKDWLVSGNDGFQEKVYRLFNAVGLAHEYQSGIVSAESLTGRGGKLALNIRSEEFNGERRLKNRIAYYVAQDRLPSKSQTSAQDLDDEVPL